MRLLYLNADPGIPLFGTKGASVHVRDSIRALARRGVDVTVLTAATDPRRGPRDGDDLPARVLEIEAGGTATDAAELRGLAANEPAERAIAHVAATGEIDAIYERYSLWSVAGANVARESGVPWFVEVNAPLVSEATRHRGLQLGSIARFLERRILGEANAVFVVSAELARYVESRGVDVSRVCELPNGWDPALFGSTPAEGRTQEDDGRFVVTFVGSLKPWHDLPTLVRAFRTLHSKRPACRLRIVGDGPLARSVRDSLADLPADAVHFTGAVPHRDVAAWLGRSDVAVAPYPPTTEDYFSPLKLEEYLAAGLPVVASRLGPVARRLRDGDNGLLVAPGDATAFADALLRLHDDVALRARLSDGARSAARGRTWDDVAERALGVMERHLVPARIATGTVTS
ncbi:MAG: glycosyltransferase family 4 protein [bacterium]